jgi:hypothetical protein
VHDRPRPARPDGTPPRDVRGRSAKRAPLARGSAAPARALGVLVRDASSALREDERIPILGLLDAAKRRGPRQAALLAGTSEAVSLLCARPSYLMAPSGSAARRRDAGVAECRGAPIASREGALMRAGLTRGLARGRAMREGSSERGVRSTRNLTFGHGALHEGRARKGRRWRRARGGVLRVPSLAERRHRTALRWRPR